MSKKDRRARKRANKTRGKILCESCGYPAPDNELGDHDTPWSRGIVCWDGLVVVAWCQRCGWEYGVAA